MARPRRVVPTVPVKLGGDTVNFLRRVPVPAVRGRSPTLDEAVRELARLALVGKRVTSFASETFGIPETSDPARLPR